MNERILQSALVSSFMNGGVMETSVPFKRVERRMRKRVQKGTGLKTTEVESALKDGVPLLLSGMRYIAFLGTEKSLSRGAVKALSRNIDKKTNSPKKTRGTVYRRNSTVVERRRQNSKWRTGQAAINEKRRSRDVLITPYEKWKIGEADKLIRIKQENKETIDKKRVRRALKKQELPSEITIFIDMLSKITESNGIANGDELKRRLTENIRNSKPLPIFFIWGPPYVGQGEQNIFLETTSPERIMATWVEDVLGTLKQAGISIRPFLLYADVYGKVINGIPEKQVDSYGQTLKTRFEEVADFIPWSELIQENSIRYKQIKQTTKTEVSAQDIERATAVQRKLGRIITPDTAFQLALQYKIERLVEGALLYEGCRWSGERIENIIKLGTAASRKRNDEPYEQNLPRFYIKNMPRAPWSKSR